MGLSKNGKTNIPFPPIEDIIPVFKAMSRIQMGKVRKGSGIPI